MTMLKELKNGKAEGADNIPGEMLKYLGEKWLSADSDDDPTRKESKRNRMSDYRTISLT